MLSECDLAVIDPALHAHYALNKLDQESVPAAVEQGAWTRSGPGPIAFIGNTWTNGVTLAPEYKVIGATKLVALIYSWRQESVGAWASQSAVRLIVTDVTTLVSYSLDVTASPTGTVIAPALNNLSANCSMVFQLKAGSRTGRLKNPPYIETCSVQARYKRSDN